MYAKYSNSTKMHSYWL